jgi:HNH endonuclease
MALAKRLRFAILQRDAHRCFYCGRAAPDVKLTVDHVVPVVLGGSDDPKNLVTACVDCNAGKTSVQPDPVKVEAVAADALRWSEAIRRVAEQRAADRAVMAADVSAFDEVWLGWTYNQPRTITEKVPVPRDDSWRVSIERFLELGLTFEILESLVQVTMKKATDRNIPIADTWRYFCGCAWNELERMQAAAAALIESEKGSSANGTPSAQTTETERRYRENERITRELLDQLP